MSGLPRSPGIEAVIVLPPPAALSRRVVWAYSKRACRPHNEGAMMNNIGGLHRSLVVSVLVGST